MKRDAPALFRRLPGAAGRIPWVPLGDLPTPVERLSPPVSTIRDRIWVKRDDLSSCLYGGNKVRSLEFLLGHALCERAERVVTAGAAGSHHVAAAAVFARELGLGVEAMLWRRPSPQRAADPLPLLARLGAAVRSFDAPGTALAALLLRWGLLRFRGERAVLLPPGGFSVRGALGFVDAALELGEQVAAGEADAPDHIWIACGTGTSAAGLLVGLPLARLQARVMAVRVTPKIVCGRTRILRLAAAVRKLLARTGLYEIPCQSDTVALLDVVDSQYAPGYGIPSRSAENAVAVLSGAGLPGDTTYTGRALAALLERAQREAGRHLFWHTLPGVPGGNRSSPGHAV